jgi:cyclopropane fatty-acyl-phospholipid synthase-like methyltransferase
MSTQRTDPVRPAGKPLPQEEMDHLTLILGGHIFFQTLAAAVQLNLFSLLSEHGRLTLPAIAKHLGIEEKPARILLLGCTSLRLLGKDGDAYFNTPVAQQLLTRETPGNIVAIVEWQHFINYRPMYFFYDAIKANGNVGLDVIDGPANTLYERLTRHPELEKIFQDAMKAISVQANAMLADREKVDLSHVKHLVDVGGGNGTNIITLARQYPALRASVFDSPTVCEIARQNIAAHGHSDRLDAVPGNCFTDPFPKGADCIVFCHFFTIWSEEKNRQLLRKCYEALPPGGTAVLFQMLQHDDGTGPLTAAMGSPYFLALATGEGMLYTGAEYETWMREAGFSSVKTQRLPRDHGAVIGRKG